MEAKTRLSPLDSFYGGFVPSTVKFFPPTPRFAAKAIRFRLGTAPDRSGLGLLRTFRHD